MSTDCSFHLLVARCGRGLFPPQHRTIQDRKLREDILILMVLAGGQNDLIRGGDCTMYDLMLQYSPHCYCRTRRSQATKPPVRMGGRFIKQVCEKAARKLRLTFPLIHGWVEDPFYQLPHSSHFYLIMPLRAPTTSSL